MLDNDDFWAIRGKKSELENYLKTKRGGLKPNGLFSSIKRSENSLKRPFLKPNGLFGSFKRNFKPNGLFSTFKRGLVWYYLLHLIISRMFLSSEIWSLRQFWQLWRRRWISVRPRERDGEKGGLLGCSRLRGDLVVDVECLVVSHDGSPNLSVDGRLRWLLFEAGK